MGYCKVNMKVDDINYMFQWDICLNKAKLKNIQTKYGKKCKSIWKSLCKYGLFIWLFYWWNKINVDYSKPFHQICAV